MLAGGVRLVTPVGKGFSKQKKKKKKTDSGQAADKKGKVERGCFCESVFVFVSV